MSDVRPRGVLGTMTIGQQVDENEAGLMLDRFCEAGGTEIDTAYVYNEGRTEEILGSILAGRALSVATKVNPRVTGHLDRRSVVDQVERSLHRMGLPIVDLLYLHFPDPETPLEVTLEACNELYENRTIKELGLSNFAAWQVVDAWRICEANGWIPPTVYQGLYNAVSRKIESELIPALRRFGIRLYVYNPLAGGLLSGKYESFDRTPTEGRFHLRSSYRGRYWKQSFFDAVDVFAAACRDEHVAPAAAALRWLTNHSAIDTEAGDRVILGVSSLRHLDENLEALNAPQLSESITEAIDEAWLHATSDSPSYFRTVTG